MCWLKKERKKEEVCNKALLQVHISEQIEPVQWKAACIDSWNEAGLKTSDSHVAAVITAGSEMRCNETVASRWKYRCKPLCKCLNAFQMAAHWPASVSLLLPVERLFKQEGRERSAADCGRHWRESMRGKKQWAGRLRSKKIFRRGRGMKSVGGYDVRSGQKNPPLLNPLVLHFPGTRMHW